MKIETYNYSTSEQAILQKIAKALESIAKSLETISDTQAGYSANKENF